MKVLVIGGSGHVGSRLAIHLKHSGMDVGISSRQDLSFEPWCRGFRVHRVGDINTTDWNEVISGYSHVVHLVSPQESQCQADPEYATSVVVAGSRALGKAAASAGIRVIYFSTSQVYGTRLEGCLDERSNCLPETPYARVHYEAEKILMDSCGDSLSIVRLANSVGLPGNPKTDSWHLLTHDIAREVYQRGTITLKSPGAQHRNFVPLSEVSRATEFLLKLAVPPQIVNVSSETSQSVRSMAEKVGALYHRKTGNDVRFLIPTASDSDTENPHTIASTILKMNGFEFEYSAAMDSEILAIFDFLSEL